MALVRSPAQISSSSDSCRSRCSYDVFLSFRGEDTRKTFTDHLYTASVNAGFRTFRDDDELPRGQDIKRELEKAIKESRSSVIVFSKDYATSGWCLDELVMIMERKRTTNHVVLPVFYHVDPSHVRNQTGALAKAFARHERNRSLKDKVKEWRKALTEVADLAGMVLQNEADGVHKQLKDLFSTCKSTLHTLLREIQYLPSMKVLNLSHSHDLTETPDFSSIPNLERLILKDCASLVDFHESIGILRRLVCFNVEDCKSVRKLPKNISLLILLETLIISGCSSLNEFPVDMSKMESLKVFEADGVPIHRLLTTTRKVELWSRPNVGISWASHLPRNLVTIHLRNCNLSEDDFPKDLGNLSSLQTLDLDGNPICSLPEGIRGITGLQYLSVECCTRLKSLVRLPNIRHLTILDCTSLEKITYESYWCALLSARSNNNLVDQQHSHKLEPIERVDEELINLLGLTELESLGTIMMGCAKWYIRQWEGLHPVQGLYQRGIFSTFLPGNEVPGQFSHTSKGSSVSFIVPLLPQLNTRGLNVFSVVAKANNNDSDPMIKAINIDGSEHPIITVVSNETKGLNWIYGPTFYGVPVDGKDVIWLSHWKFGTRYLEGGDKVTFSILTTSEYKVMECGIHLVYHEEEEKIISAQLNPADNPFYPDLVQVIPGTYLLFSYDFWYLHLLPWLNDFIRQFCKYEYKLDNINGDPSFVNSDEITVDRKEGQQGDNTLAKQSGNNINTRSRRAWRVLIIAVVFFFSVFPLFFALKSFMFQREKQHATILIPT